jgi:adenylate kinase
LSDFESRRGGGRDLAAGVGKFSARKRSPSTGLARCWVALTGTPGTGKSSVARRLPARLHSIEVRDLALRLDAGRRVDARSVEVDLGALRSAFRKFIRSAPNGVAVGHLAHFLPVSYIVVLRCNPLELARRLRGTRRTKAERTENLLSETLDIILVEALATGVPVREVDTTGRSVETVAREVARLVHQRPKARYGRINWLADPCVTEELLRGAF